MGARLFGTLRANRERVIPIVVAALLLSGLFFSLFGAKPAQADYFTGCGYGYGSNGSGFGYSATNSPTYGYGYGYGGTFGYGYGDTICPIGISTPNPLPVGTVGSSYSFTMTATNGVGPYTWSATGLPSTSGLTVSTAGVISGTPTQATTYSVTFIVTDSNGMTYTSSGYTLAAVNSNATTTTTVATTTGGPTTTTTVAPTTTTTTGPKPVCNLFAKRFLGFAVVGRGMSRAIIGGCFYGQPKVTSNEAGTRVGVLHDNGRVLIVRVTVPGGSKPGWHTLTIREPNGKICRVNYLVRILGR